MLHSHHNKAFCLIVPAATHLLPHPVNIVCSGPPVQVLCASNDAHTQVDPIVPPEGVPNGERITFEG